MTAAMVRPGSRATPAPLVVVGDALLDVDVCGPATRLAPDAPVPVLDDPREHLRPGGAALAALLAARTGARPVVLVASVGDDPDGDRLRDLLARHGVGLVDLPGRGGTTTKRRIRADGQTLARLDSGGRQPTAWSDEADAALRSAAAVLVSDYGRGVADLAVPALEGLAVQGPAVEGSAVEGRAVEGRGGRRRADGEARARVVWDPHPRGGPPAAGTLLATPNAAEAAGVLDVGGGSGEGSTSLRAVAERADRLVKRWGVAAVAVTLGARGALLSQGVGSPAVVPAPPARADDPCGAGDCFAATAALALAGGALLSEAVEAAVRAAAAFVDGGGASGLGDLAATGDARAPQLAPDEPSEEADDPLAVVQRVRSTGGTVVATGGCFDLLHAGHVATLDAARALGDCLVVCLNSDDSVRRLKGPTRPLSPAADRARVLAALGSVDAVVVFDEDTPEAALARLRPDVWVKGGDYAGAELPEAALLAGWGGQAVVVPYLEGRSTTRLVEAAGGPTGASAGQPVGRSAGRSAG